MQNRESSLAITNHGDAIQFSLRVPMELRKDGTWVYSTCRPFDVHGQGKNETEADGFCFERKKGSHRSYIKEGILRPIIIPEYDEVGIDIIKSNMRTANMSRDRY